MLQDAGRGHTHESGSNQNLIRRDDMQAISHDGLGVLCQEMMRSADDARSGTDCMDQNSSQIRHRRKVDSIPRRLQTSKGQQREDTGNELPDPTHLNVQLKLYSPFDKSDRFVAWTFQERRKESEDKETAQLDRKYIVLTVLECDVKSFVNDIRQISYHNSSPFADLRMTFLSPRS